MTWTILKMLKWTEEYFRKAEIASPRVDAEWLLADTLELKRVDLYVRFDQLLAPAELAEFKSKIRRRAKREPLAYIMGSAEFYGIPLKVEPSVLIPRPETEQMVENVVKRSPRSILDIGTGSGCIAIAVAKELPESAVAATEISASALTIARKNAADQGLGRISFYEADLFPPAGTFDTIVANPPYIAEGVLATLMPEVRDFEPTLALAAGTDGLDFYRRIIAGAPGFLNPNGYLILEMGDGQAERIRHLVEAGGSLTWVESKKDYNGIARIGISQKRIG